MFDINKIVNSEFGGDFLCDLLSQKANSSPTEMRRITSGLRIILKDFRPQGQQSHRNAKAAACASFRRPVDLWTIMSCMKSHDMKNQQPESQNIFSFCKGVQPPLQPLFIQSNSKSESGKTNTKSGPMDDEKI